MSGALQPAAAAWADRIRPHLEQAVESILAAGVELVKAKDELPHGQFTPLLADLGMAPRVAQKFMAIARSAVLGNATLGSHLPTGLTVLYELTRVPDEALEAAIESGEVNPSTTRAEAAALHEPPLTDEEQDRLAALEATIAAGLAAEAAAVSTATAMAAIAAEDDARALAAAGRGAPEVEAGAEAEARTSSVADYFLDSEEQRDAFQFADAGDEAFEAALAEARAEDDLSRANVVRKIESRATKPSPAPRSLAAIKVDAVAWGLAADIEEFLEDAAAGELSLDLLEPEVLTRVRAAARDLLRKATR